jgi:hypothetical protein
VGEDMVGAIFDHRKEKAKCNKEADEKDGDHHERKKKRD